MSEAAKREVKARSEAEDAWRIDEDDANRRRELELFARRLPAAPDRIVEIGCGRGRLTELLAAWADHVLAIDVAREMATHTRGRLADRAGVDVAVADADRLPVVADAADVVVASQVVGHLPDPTRFLREAARVLRPGGRLLCSTGNLLNPFNALYQYKTVLDPDRDVRLRAMTEAARAGESRAYWLRRQGHQRDTLCSLAAFAEEIDLALTWSAGTVVVPPGSVVAEWLPDGLLAAGGRVREGLPTAVADNLTSWVGRTLVVEFTDERA